MTIYKDKITMGDTHSIIEALNVIKNHHYEFGTTNSTFFHVGDFGIGFAKPERVFYQMVELYNYLALTNNNLVVTHGNHDCPAYFQGGALADYLYNHNQYSSDKWIDVASEFYINNDRILLAPNYTQLDNILLVGGAISIDRTKRVHNISCWGNDGEFKLNKTALSKMTGVEIVITHSSPNFAFPFCPRPEMVDGWTSVPIVEGWALQDSSLKYEILKERNKLEEMFDILKENNTLKSWYYGHFHHSNTEFVKYYKGDDEVSVRFQCLNINEVKEIRC